MGILKKQQDEKRDNWEKLGKRCQSCCSPIPFDEKDEFFSTGKCGSCNNHFNKMMEE